MKIRRILFYFSVIFLFGSTSSVLAENISANQINNVLTYQSYVEDQGWQDSVNANGVSGTVGESLALEAIKINLPINGVTLSYNTHVKNQGWLTPVNAGQDSGSSDFNLPIEAVTISLENAPGVDLYYRVHSANFGWLGWAKNGEIAGTTGCGFPVQAIQIIATSAGAEAPGDTTAPSVDKSQITMSLRTHTRNIGWSDEVNRGVSGTTGQSLPIESIDLSVTDPTGQSGVIGEAYIEGIGWQGQDEINAPIGTTSEGRKIEAYRYNLVGPASAIYDLNYRSHMPNLGWMGWTTTGNNSGITNANLGVEAVDILLEKKGTAANTDNPYVDVQTPLGMVPTAPTCVLINKTMQRMAFYQNYDLKVNTNVVTGMQRIDDTKNGDYTIQEKVTPYHTYGPGYDAWTDYWLTIYRGDIYGFNGEGHIVDAIGIHDASWRSNWSSTAWLTNGSHGCVNTPYSAMKYIFENSSVGTPVIVR